MITIITTTTIIITIITIIVITIIITTTTIIIIITGTNQLLVDFKRQAHQSAERGAVHEKVQPRESR